MTRAKTPRALAIDRVFAYGTLMTGFSRRPLLGSAVFEGRAGLRGSLHDFGDYPGLVLDDVSWVWGELYRVPDLATRLARLDHEEGYDPGDEAGSLYRRRRVTVSLEGGGARGAWAYVYNPRVGGPPERGPRIDSGDWRTHAAGRGAVSSR